ncbi:MAG: hypothetical protein VYE77_04840 [Planctomycetota bacterium]|nr:hypothetical protein [Planctomycetota bacterium]
MGTTGAAFPPWTTDHTRDWLGDLMIGVPNETKAGASSLSQLDAGLIHVLLGERGAPGLTVTWTELIEQGRRGLAGGRRAL